MPQVVKQTIVNDTKNGEITVNLNLTLTIKMDGSDTIITGVNKKITKDDDKVELLIPELESLTGDLISDFGKEV